VSIQRFHETGDFAALVRRTRRERGFSQEELAERANISRSGLQKIEEGRGSPSLETAIKVLRVLSLDIGVVSREDPFKRVERGRPHAE
jgi:transcriptional regulator with XRE-family HTH domain